MNTTPHTSSISSGARSVATEGRTLPLVRSEIGCDASGGLARVVFTQTFTNPHPEPLHVTYKLPLPADAAVGGFAFEIAGERSVGRVETKKKAREAFEEAVLQGKTAALLEEETSALFTQELGNVPPGAEVHVEVTLDCPLAWLGDAQAGGAWEFRFPLAAAPRYLGGNGSTATNASLAPLVIDVATAPIAARASLSMRIRDTLVVHRSPESPSHPLQTREAFGAYQVELGSGNEAELDRDVVVRWPVAAASPKIALDACVVKQGEAMKRFGLLSLVPPSMGGSVGVAGKVKRDVTVLLDTSGSMQGSPLDQAKRIASAIVESLDERDSFEVIEFGNSARPYKSGSRAASKGERAEAVRWIHARQASGGTEMLSGVKAALTSLGAGAQRQIVLITDGLIGEEGHIVGALAKGLPASSRFHAVGVGAAANRALLMPIARAGRGAEAIVGIGEDAEPAVARLLRRMCGPVVVDLAIEGSAIEGVAARHLPDLFTGAPARIPVALRREGGEIVITGRTHEGPFRDTVYVDADGSLEPRGSDALARLYGRERVEDLELELSIGKAKSEIDPQIERIGLAHQIATRLTSFVAVSAEAMVDPTAPTRRETMPHVLAHGMSAEGVGLAAPFQAIAAKPVVASFGKALRMSAPMPASAAPAAPPPAGRYGARAESPRPGAPMPQGGGLGGAPKSARDQSAGGGFEKIAKRRAPESEERAKQKRQDDAFNAPESSASPPPAPPPPPAQYAPPAFAPPEPMPSEEGADGLLAELGDAGPDRDEAAPKRDESLWGRVKRAFTGDDLRAPDAKPKPATEAKKVATREEPLARARRDEGKKGGARSAWIGRILQRLGARVVLELAIPDDAFEFSLFGATATVRFKDGSSASVAFDLSATTRAGTYAKGHVVRVVLVLTEREAADVEEIRIVLSDNEIIGR